MDTEDLLSRFAVALGIGLLIGLERSWQSRGEKSGSRGAWAVRRRRRDGVDVTAGAAVARPARRRLRDPGGGGEQYPEQARHRRGPGPRPFRPRRRSDVGAGGGRRFGGAVA